MTSTPDDPVEPSASPGTSRRYRSPLRAQRAAETRDRVRTAARELFRRDGFEATTVTAIAARAGVSVQTVYAGFGSKAAIVRELLQQMEEGADAARWRVRIATETDPAQILAAFAAWTRAFFAASRPDVDLARQVGDDPAVRELAALGDRHRRAAVSGVVDRIAEAGALRDGLTRPQAVDRAWMLTGLEMYLLATSGCDWSEDAYQAWLTELLTSQLVGERSRG